MIFFSCKNEPETSVDVSDIDVDFSVKRFEVAFYQSTPNTLEKVKDTYPLLFPGGTPDSIWVQKIKDKDEQELFAESQKIYADFSAVEKELKTLFKHIKYYNPDYRVPDVITMLTNIDYDNRLIYTDSLLLISLDAYLGKDHKFYADYPNYIKENNHKGHIAVDIAKTMAGIQMPPVSDRSFLGKMIHAGKKMYLLDAYLPAVSDKEKSGYTQEKLDWAKENEEQIWKYFIDNNFLYSTDTKLNKRFLDNAPFSKFYLEQDRFSPGRIGEWIGWQIVRSYMRHNDVSLPELIQLNTSDLFKRSKYKPRK